MQAGSQHQVFVSYSEGVEVLHFSWILVGAKNDVKILINTEDKNIFCMFLESVIPESDERILLSSPVHSMPLL